MSLNWITEKAKAAKNYVMNNPKKAATVTGVMVVAIATDTARFMNNPVGVTVERLAATGLTAAAVYGIEAVYNRMPAMPAMPSLSFLGRGNSNAPEAEVDAAPAPKSPRGRGRKKAVEVEAEVETIVPAKRSSSRVRKK